MPSEYEVFAVRDARREAPQHERFIRGDPHDGPMPMDYLIWVAKNAERSVVIDIRFTAETGDERRRRPTPDPITRWPCWTLMRRESRMLS